MPLGPFQVMTYLVACPHTREAVIIDPAGEEDKILTLIKTQGVKIKYILNTHGHSDHVLGNPKLKEVFNVPVCMHEAVFFRIRRFVRNPQKSWDFRPLIPRT